MQDAAVSKTPAAAVTENKGIKVGATGTVIANFTKDDVMNAISEAEQSSEPNTNLHVQIKTNDNISVNSEVNLEQVFQSTEADETQRNQGKKYNKAYKVKQRESSSEVKPMDSIPEMNVFKENKIFWIIGDHTVHIQRAVTRHGGTCTQIHTSQQLTHKKNIDALMDAMNMSPPQCIWVSLPGCRTLEGNRHDRRILGTVNLLCTRLHEMKKTVIIEGAERNPAWKMNAIQGITQRTDMRMALIKWCSLAITSDNLPVERTSKLVTNCHIPENLSLCCGGKTHVKMRMFPERVMTTYIENLIQTLLFGGSGTASTFHLDKQCSDDYDLGEHADESLLLRNQSKKKVIEATYDDCGENTTPLDIAEAFTVYDESDSQDDSDDEYDTMFDSSYFNWSLSGSNVDT